MSFCIVNYINNLKTDWNKINFENEKFTLIKFLVICIDKMATNLLVIAVSQCVLWTRNSQSMQ